MLRTGGDTLTASDALIGIDHRHTVLNADGIRRTDLGAGAETETAKTASFARMTAVDEHTYILTVRAWCDSAKYWDVYFDLLENCSKALGDNGIADPEDRLAVRLVNDN